MRVVHRRPLLLLLWGHGGRHRHASSSLSLPPLRRRGPVFSMISRTSATSHKVGRGASATVLLAVAAAVGNASSSQATTLCSPESASLAASPQTLVLDESCLVYDTYHGVTVYLDRLTGLEYPAAFEEALQGSLALWQQEQRKGIWIHVPIAQAAHIAVATGLGFEFHLVTPDRQALVLSRWLPPDTVSRLPLGPTHQVGVGCWVPHPHDPSRLLVVQEQTGPAAAAGLWKMPTGLADAGEDLHQASVRELKEETGLEAEFGGVVAFRQAHPTRGGAGGTRPASDLFFVCRMILAPHHMTETDTPWTACPDEIAAIQWMAVEDFCNQPVWGRSPVYQALNEAVRQLATQLPSPIYELQHQTLPVGFAPGTNTIYKSQL